MSSSSTKRRLFLGAGLLVCGLLAIAVLARAALAGFAVGYALKEAGATEIAFNVTRASPWHVVVEDVAFLLQAQSLSAKRVSIERRHWWSSSLGKVRVEEARVPVAVDRLVAAARTDTSPAPASAPNVPPRVPLEELSIDGQIVLQAEGAPDQALTVKLAAKPDSQDKWSAQLQVNAPGLAVTADGTYDLSAQQLDFSVPALSLDLKTWRVFADKVVPMPAAGGWEVEGKLSGKGTGRYAGGNFTSAGTLQVREGFVTNAAKKITAEGIEADLEFTDFAKVITKSGTLRVQQLRNPQLPLSDLAVGLSLNGPDRIEVSQATLAALGGRVSAEPFTFFPTRDELDVVVVVDGIRVEDVMALMRELPAKVNGRVSGRFPLSLGASGVHLGTGWLSLTPGVNAEVAFAAKGLLTGGMSPKSTSYPVLEKIETGLLKLRINELRLDIRPKEAPPGRSATLHLAGEPVDPGVKAPVVLDLNVNGQLEDWLNFILNPRVNTGTKP